MRVFSVLMEMAKVINSGTRLIPDRFCFLFHKHVDGNRNRNTVDERRPKIVRNRVFDWHLSFDWQQKATENTVSIDSD